MAALKNGIVKNKARNNTSNDDTCVVCFRKSKIFSIGECDHPVCYECSTRMRVLCQRTECPICRKDMAKVIFTYKIHSFSSITHHNMKCERRYSIYFENDNIMKAYDTLLQHKCSKCPDQLFRNFILLKEHMRKLHELFYCDLCVDNLKIFTHERRCYSRELLGQHRRLGDKDDKSHRGHPLCKFCDTRFMDNDELFRHLRRDHFFCHFCDADGIHQYYNDYEALRNHFQEDHYLCEEGNCREERFTSAFRTKLDLQAHTTQYHGHGMSKLEARQARTVDIAFTVNHRQGHFTERERGRGGRRGEGRGRRQPQDFEEQVAAASAVPPSEMMAKQQAVDINCVQDFPSLKGGKVGAMGEGGGSNSSSSIAHKLAQQNRFTIRTTRGHHLSEEEFPSLVSTTSVSVSGNVPSYSNSSNVSVPSASVHFSVNTKKNNNLQEPQSQTGPNVSIQYNCTSSSFTPSQADMSNPFAGKGKGKPRIGNVSHTRNITVKSTPTGTRPKSSVMEEEFPLLQPSNKPFPGGGHPHMTTWVSSDANSSSVVAGKGPKKNVNSSEGSSRIVNNNNSNNNNNNNSSVKNKNNSILFESEDFPTLAPSTQSQEKLNYSGRSSLTIPMKKALPVKEKVLETDENSGGKGKKKKKGNAVDKSDTIENSKNTQNNSNPPKTAKKKPLVLNNFLEPDDPDGPVEDFSRKKEGEYESFVPVLSSNVKLVSSNNHSNTKKSELEIGPLSAPEFNPEDFPSLGSAGLPSKGSKKSSKASSQPYENSSWHQSSTPSKKRPSIPPGFSKKSQPVTPPGFANTDMTFTSSLGQKFAISPTSEVPPKSSSLPPKSSSAKENKKPSKLYSFKLPPEFEKRNKLLIDALREGCVGNSDKFNKFKQLSQIFRSGQIKGQQYYERCKQILGKNTFLSILPELLALLPDIEKQQAVYEAYRKVDGGKGCDTCFAVCAVCQQVLLSDDFPVHMSSHEFSPEDFPSLNTSLHSKK